MSTVELPAPGPARPRPVPSLSDSSDRRTWSAESDRRADAGLMFPDLFQQALAGTPLAGAVKANSEHAHRSSLDTSHQSVLAGQPGQPDHHSDAETAEVGAFTGTSAKRRRWRL